MEFLWFSRLRYLIDDKSPMATRRSWRNASRGAAAKSYVVGLQRISIDDGADLHCYGYDAHNGVRLLIDGSGNVTDAWDYDAFGNCGRADRNDRERLHVPNEQMEAIGCGFF